VELAELAGVAAKMHLMVVQVAVVVEFGIAINQPLIVVAVQPNLHNQATQDFLDLAIPAEKVQELTQMPAVVAVAVLDKVAKAHGKTLLTAQVGVAVVRVEKVCKFGIHGTHPAVAGAVVAVVKVDQAVTQYEQVDKVMVVPILVHT
jgi:hypothetical protein